MNMYGVIENSWTKSHVKSQSEVRQGCKTTCYRWQKKNIHINTKHRQLWTNWMGEWRADLQTPGATIFQTKPVEYQFQAILTKT